MHSSAAKPIQEALSLRQVAMKNSTLHDQETPKEGILSSKEFRRSIPITFDLDLLTSI